MTTNAIIREINKLPLTEKLLLVEKTLKTIRQEGNKNLEHAVHALYIDYKTDRELTVFTDIDIESFYETR